uniref:Uncharacterized protein n=1 Tax=Arundo donax TaxID=35708 RepID=A0A0A9ATC7_ARUDO
MGVIIKLLEELVQNMQ